MKNIPLTRGYIAIVDDADYPWISQFKWCAQSGPDNDIYAARRLPKTEGGGVALMHRFIMEAKNTEEVDHRNFNKLDNRRLNLRLCSHLQNLQNRKPSKNNQSGYKGVSWHKRQQKWQVKININGKGLYLGLFNDKIEAAHTYDRYARQHFGEYAYLNFPS